jgi:BlaI family penicillinase repressor
MRHPAEPAIPSRRTRGRVPRVRGTRTTFVVDSPCLSITSVVVEQKPLSELQLAVVRALWGLGEGTVSDVLREVVQSGRELAPTTVATVLRRLEKDGWVEHRERGRQFVYRARVSREQATGGVLDRITRGFFGGSIPALVSQLLESDQVSSDDLALMQALIARKEGKKES